MCYGDVGAPESVGSGAVDVDVSVAGELGAAVVGAGELGAAVVGAAVLGGRFVAVIRAVMPAAAGAAQVPYRTFLIYNVAGGIIWGVGYCLLGYLAGSAYVAIERKVGAGLAIALAVIILAAVATWAVRRHRSVVR